MEKRHSFSSFLSGLLRTPAFQLSVKQIMAIKQRFKIIQMLFRDGEECITAS